MAIVLAGLAVLVSAAVPAWAEGPYNESDRVGAALHGYDVVAYHTEGRALEGSAEHTVQWEGTTWRFASEANAERFRADPERYAPAYGGYCAWAAAEGYIADVDPEVFEVVDGTLYLNFSRGVNRRWRRDIPGNIARADENWPQLRGRLDQ
jgi:YHS domain-containing protein